MNIALWEGLVESKGILGYWYRGVEIAKWKLKLVEIEANGDGWALICYLGCQKEDRIGEGLYILVAKILMLLYGELITVGLDFIGINAFVYIDSKILSWYRLGFQCSCEKHWSLSQCLLA